MKKLLLLALSAVSMFAADVTGTWTGTFSPEGRDPGGAHLVLKQDGSTITGSAGPEEGEQHQIREGKIENDVITFQVGAGDEDQPVMKFSLKVDGDKITGTATRQRDGQTQNAKLEVTRKK